MERNLDSILASHKKDQDEWKLAELQLKTDLYAAKKQLLLVASGP